MCAFRTRFAIPRSFIIEAVSTCILVCVIPIEIPSRIFTAIYLYTYIFHAISYIRSLFGLCIVVLCRKEPILCDVSHDDLLFILNEGQELLTFMVR